MRRAASQLVALGATAMVLVPASARLGARPVSATPADLIRAALAQRLGAGVEVAVVAIDGVPEGRVFTSARPDPSARLGRPIRFALLADRGPAVWITATVRVVGDQVVMRRAVPRGASIEADDVDGQRREFGPLPLRALPGLADAIGSRAARALRAGEVLLAGSVVVPPAVEVGDRVTVVAAVGAVEVTATFVASDRGAPGDVIRLVNPETRRVVRGRIVRKGLVEVLYEE